jgi:glycosyltransferase involved in cell wall biosynthesis
MGQNGRMASGRTIVVFPYYYENPYLNLTYLATQASGDVIVPVSRLTTFVEAVSNLASGDVMHVHWTNRIVQGAEDEESANAALDLFRDAVLAAKARGVRLLWTVHNRVPHETRWFELERSLSQFIADTADRILVMSPATAEVVSDVFTLPVDKVSTLPHPSYQGIYPPADPVRSREELGVPADLPTALFFGQMRAYKGVETLLEAVGLVASSGADIGLLLAGRTSEVERERIEQLLPSGVPVVRHHEFVDNIDVPRWFGAADLVVLPYNDILNSGSIHLAATLGVPVAVPDIPQLADQFADENWVHFYRADEGPADLARVLADIPRIRQMPNSSHRFAARISPYAVSEQFADLVASLPVQKPPSRIGRRRQGSRVSGWLNGE